jgi:hypothetical protein
MAKLTMSEVNFDLQRKMTDLNAFISSLEAQASQSRIGAAGGAFNERLWVIVEPVHSRIGNRVSHFRTTFKIDGKRVTREAALAALA